MKRVKTGEMNGIPRPEYPRMQFRREDLWLNLNGEWEFQPDPCGTGFQRGFFLPGQEFSQRITVPFCMESERSGLGIRDPYAAVWYRRKVKLPEDWQGKKILLHVGGADYLTTLWVDGKPAGRHVGGACSWSADLTSLLTPDKEHLLTICCEDDLTTGLQAAGKQSDRYESYGCLFTRVTGIYGTVWLEAVAPEGLAGIRMETDIASGIATLRPSFYNFNPEYSLTARLIRDGKEIAAAECPCRPGAGIQLRDPAVRLWSPADPFLYDLRFQICRKNIVLDEVESYLGFREVRISGNRILLNDKPIFLRFILDQGYYPEGVWTAPDDAALQRDIRLGLDSGFNGARLHQKVFEERFLYWADRMGYLVISECPDWRMDFLNPEACRRFSNEFREILLRDRNHPSIIAWTPLNETFHNRVIQAEQKSTYRQLGQYDPMPNTTFYRGFVTSLRTLAAELDPTRPFHDASGGLHADTDLCSRHFYARDIEEFKLQFRPGEPIVLNEPECPYAGQPWLIDEFGMIFPEADNLPDIAKQIRLMNRDPRCGGWCFTQLYDVEQEKNGLFRYDRSPKFEKNLLRSVFAEKPSWSDF